MITKKDYCCIDIVCGLQLAPPSLVHSIQMCAVQDHAAQQLQSSLRVRVRWQ